MKEELCDRRAEMISFHQQGIKVAEWASIIASKYNISEDSARRDWSRRRNWMHLFQKVEDPLMMAKKLVSENILLMMDADNLFEEAEDPKIQLQFMWLRLKIFRDRVNLLKEMGVFEPIRGDFEYKKRIHVEKLNDEKYPQNKGCRDREIREGALNKSTASRAYFD